MAEDATIYDTDMNRRIPDGHMVRTFSQIENNGIVIPADTFGHIVSFDGVVDGYDYRYTVQFDGQVLSDVSGFTVGKHWGYYYEINRFYYDRPGSLDPDEEWGICAITRVGGVFDEPEEAIGILKESKLAGGVLRSAYSPNKLRTSWTAGYVYKQDGGKFYYASMLDWITREGWSYKAIANRNLEIVRPDGTKKIIRATSPDPKYHPSDLIREFSSSIGRPLDYEGKDALKRSLH